MALPDLTGQNIENTYQRVLQTDGTIIYDGTGSVFLPVSASYSVTASYAEYAVSASHEIIKEVSSSYADYAKESGLSTSSISASYALTASYALNSPDTFPYTGSAIISGSLIVTGSTKTQYLTASGLNYPTIDGDEKQLITTDGSGNLFFDWSDRTNLDVKNTSGVSLSAGTPVYLTGFQGASIFQIAAASSSISSTMPAIGVLDTDLNPNDQGHATLIGAVRNVDTSTPGYSINQSLYVGEGVLTPNRPTGSAQIQKIARVGKVANNGEITILGAGRTNDIPNLQPGYAWVGDSTWNAVATPTSSFNEDPFPYTGSAVISGSLEVIGDIKSNEDVIIQIDADNNTPLSKFSIKNGTGNIIYTIDEEGSTLATTGASNNIKMGNLDGSLGTFNGISLNGNLTYPGIIGFAGGSSTNDNFYMFGEVIDMRAGGASDASMRIAETGGETTVVINHAFPVPTSHTLYVDGNGKFNDGLDITGDVSASTYYGDGSNLTGISSDPFPYTGSAIITGSLEVIGDTNITGSLTTSGSIVDFSLASSINLGLEPAFRSAGLFYINTSVNYNVTTPINVQFDQIEYNQGSSLTPSTGSNTSVITISEAGYYQVDAAVAFNTGGQRTTPGMNIFIDSVEVQGRAYGYIRNASGANEASCTLSRIIYCPGGNEQIEIRVANYAASGTCNAQQGYFQLTKVDNPALQGPAGPAGPAGQAGTSFSVSLESTGRTLALSDNLTYIKCSPSSPGATYTVPPQSDVSWPDSCEVAFEQGNAFPITIAAGSGVTINSSATLVTSGQYAVIALKRVSTNTWTLTGERATT